MLRLSNSGGHKNRGTPQRTPKTPPANGHGELLIIKQDFEKLRHKLWNAFGDTLKTFQKNSTACMIQAHCPCTLCIAQRDWAPCRRTVEESPYELYALSYKGQMLDERLHHVVLSSTRQLSDRHSMRTTKCAMHTVHLQDGIRISDKR